MTKLERHENIETDSQQLEHKRERALQLVNTSHATIRGDLAELESEGFSNASTAGGLEQQKIRGLSAGVSTSTTWKAQNRRGGARKNQRRDDNTDAGTTTLQIAKLLVKSGKHVQIITNSIAIAQETADYIDPGVRRQAGTRLAQYVDVGLVAIEYLRTVMVDKAFLGQLGRYRARVFAAWTNRAFLNRAMVASSREVLGP